MSRRMIALLAVVVFSATALADGIDNPLYTSWAKAKKGASVTMKTTSEVAGTKSEAVSTCKLVELTADVATVEMTTVTKAGGQEFKSDPIKMENKKLLDVPPGKKKEDALKPQGVVGEGEETLKIAGKEYKTKWVQSKFSKDGVDYESKTWTNDEVPGLMLKMESKTSGKNFSTTSVTEVTEVKLP